MKFSQHHVLAAAIVTVSMQQVAYAHSEYDIEVAPLAQTIAQIARQNNVSISANPELLKGKTAPAIKGKMRTAEALNLALLNSGLELIRSDDGTVYSVKPKENGNTTSQGTTSFVTQDQVIALPAIMVVAETDPYLANRSSSVATKSTLTPRRTPFTINQVSQEVIQERGDQSIFETLESFAGLTSASNNGDIGQGMSRSLSVRGFSVGQTLVNGQRTYSSNAGNAQNTDILEAVEVLRGPAGLYYGSAEPGGVINLRYKRPKAEAAYEILVRTDSKGSYGGMLDATGSITTDQVLRYRGVLSYQHRKDDQDRIWSEPKSGMLAVSYVPNDQFETSLTYERAQMNSVPEQINNSIDARTGKFYDIPKDFFWGSLDDEAERTTDSVLWDMKWDVAPLLKVNANFNYQQYEQFWQNTRFSGASDVDGNVDRYVSGRQSEGKSYSGNIDFSGKFNTWQLGHEWLIGVGLGNEQGSSSGRAVASESRKNQPYYVGTINIYHPEYKNWGHRDRIYADPLTPGSERDDKNVYLQDVLTLPNQQTRIMLGTGWTEYKTTPASMTATSKVRTESEWTPRIAIMHDVSPTATAYVSYGENFTQNSLGNYDMLGNEITDPVYGTQYEIGYKQELFDGRALMSAAIYRLDKENILQMVQEPEITCESTAKPSPGTPGQFDPKADCRYQLTGLERSEGLEFSLSGQITDWWLADVSFAYIDAKYKETHNLANLGRTKANTPKQNFVLWNKFKLHESAELGRLNAGIGLKAWSDAHGNWSENQQTGDVTSNINPGYALVDISLSWDKQLQDNKYLNVGFTVKNLFDKTYYDRNRFANNGNIVWGDERRALLTAQLKF